MDSTLSDAIADYIEQRKQTKLEPPLKALNKVLEKSDDPVVIAQAKADYAEQAAPIEAAFKPDVWLTDAAKRAKQISLATHAPKYTHSDAKASSMLVTQHEINSSYVTTASLKEKAIDAVGNAAVHDVAKLLKIEVAGESLITQLQAGHLKALNAFTDDEQVLNEWQAGFKEALGDAKLAGHTLSKQLYYPVSQSNSKDQAYHLLIPLTSSAVSQKLHNAVTQTRFGEEAKAIKEARKKGHYHPYESVSFVETAIQNFGGSQPQNISLLNSKSERGSKCFLLSCAPPSYQGQVKAPSKQTSFFNREFSYLTAQNVKEFKAFLANLKDSDRNFKTRYKRDFWYTQPILDALFERAAILQNQTELTGWATSADIKMKKAHCLWLDVFNDNASFQAERDKREWQDEVAHDFATWLLRKLENKDAYLLGDNEHSYFKKLCLQQLKAFERHTPKLGDL
ncbi:type I-F CRISPR-associated protein Csy1 [Pseudoalteromonas ruthenica]|uniref:CRISPR-associated protein Csy1 n=1 Tax=Pseudoalteromonas ruthenica TaxID=151081 RepID=A0A0F4Q2H8_9GAMM|nr:type I-F CRISPR-associated protein Csy1 [Pseudoalteromonas ruthenica]KJZ00767.1 CRISPR-associated protein Csy1 [Pseudoalteromonas ruthenica]KJZ01180.1 CRISPR-associated protein Csy1 [Pseudoalteromonas ruthenica]TMO85655.1 type I-F CRISPR-associated protein Csy1 [Pseudoalteromonas ruthenica]TMO92424.1 type I-F CRISPR-associated protein Csy1 [Pseudoalteromonas ruthenica]TMO98894.1 type I-F CRISPR-associated protein Csy1 [Pseudoalteromonas ruthenica]